MILRQLRVPDRQLVPQCGVAHLRLRDRLNELVVHEQPVHVQQLVARGVRGLEHHRAPAFGVLDRGAQGRLEELGLVLQLLHAIAFPWGPVTIVSERGPSRASRAPCAIRTQFALSIRDAPMTTVVLAEFSAPWSRSVRVATAASVAVLLLIMVAGLFTGPQQLLLWRLAMLGVPLVVLLGALPFMVRGYALTETHIEVRRLGWSAV